MAVVKTRNAAEGYRGKKRRLGTVKALLRLAGKAAQHMRQQKTVLCLRVRSYAVPPRARKDTLVGYYLGSGYSVLNAVLPHLLCAGVG